MMAALVWLAVAVGALGIDLLTSNFFFVGFCPGALAALVAAVWGVSWPVQLSLFAGLSAVAMIVGYPWVRKSLKRVPKLLTQEQHYIGRELVLDEDVTDKTLVKIDGVYWTVKNEGPALRKGERAQVVSIEGNKIVITKHWEE